MKQIRRFKMAMALFLVVGLLISTAAIAAEKGNQETIQGVLEKGEKGITIIKTDDGQTFTILGKNMAEMIGKSVKVTGMLTKGSKSKSVIVSSFEEITN